MDDMLACRRVSNGAMCAASAAGWAKHAAQHESWAKSFCPTCRGHLKSLSVSCSGQRQQQQHAREVTPPSNGWAALPRSVKFSELAIAAFRRVQALWDIGWSASSSDERNWEDGVKTWICRRTPGRQALH